MQFTDRQMALELKRYCPLGRAKAGNVGRLRKGTTLSGKMEKETKPFNEYYTPGLVGLILFIKSRAENVVTCFSQSTDF